MSFRTPLKDARGLGAAQHGTGHWWAQRLTSIALVPLILWLVIGIAAFGDADYATVIAWIGSPVNAVLLILTLVALFYHGVLGIQVVLEDYVDNGTVRLAAIVVVKFAAIILAASAAFAVLKIAFGG